MIIHAWLFHQLQCWRALQASSQYRSTNFLWASRFHAVEMIFVLFCSLSSLQSCFFECYPLWIKLLCYQLLLLVECNPDRPNSIKGGGSPKSSSVKMSHVWSRFSFFLSFQPSLCRSHIRTKIIVMCDGFPWYLTNVVHLHFDRSLRNPCFVPWILLCIHDRF